MGTDEQDALLARAESAEGQLRRTSTAQATLRSATRTVLSQCECGGTGKIRVQRGFFTREIECFKCLPLREALATGEIV